MTGWFARLAPEKSFLRSILTLAGGTAIAQGLAVIVSPILSRLYSPREFGVLAVYIAIFSLVAVAATLRYELAIPLPERDEDAINVLAVALASVLLTSLLLTLVAWLAGAALLRAVHAEAIGPYVWLIPVSFVGMGAYSAFNFWAVRRKAFRQIALTKLNQNLGMVIVQLALGVLKAGPVGLVLGDAVGRANGSGSFARSVFRDDRALLKHISPGAMWLAARRYYRFPVYSAPAAILNSSATSLPPLLIASAYGSLVTGWFGFAVTLLAAPMVLVGQAISQVYIAEAAHMAHSDATALGKLFTGTSGRLFLIAAGPAGLLAILAPPAFALVFGAQWQEAGVYTRILSLMLLAQFVVFPVSLTLNILEQQALQLAWDGGRILLIALGMQASILLGGSPEITIMIYSLAMTVAYAVLFVLCLFAVERHKNELAKKKPPETTKLSETLLSGH